ncbi:MAG: quinone-dependent dihydroorotate dehydrogenase, partial [Rikenellaceae bacterium]
MYRLLIKPIILWFSTHRVRKIMLIWLYIVGKVPIIRRITPAIYRSDYPLLEREVFGVKFANPIGLAAGFDHNGDVIDGLQSIGLGFVEIGTITAESERANPAPNHFALPKDRAMIYRTGHPNRGWRYAINNLRRRPSGVIVGCSISRNGNTSYRDAGREILKSFRNLYQYTDYFTVVVNFDQIAISNDSSLSEELTKILTPLIEFRRGQSEYRPIMLKITPDLSRQQLDDVISVLISSPLDGIVAVAGSESREG